MISLCRVLESIIEYYGGKFSTEVVQLTGAKDIIIHLDLCVGYIYFTSGTSGLSFGISNDTATRNIDIDRVFEVLEVYDINCTQLILETLYQAPSILINKENGIFGNVGSTELFNLDKGIK